MPKETPVIIFLVGIFGASRASYARQMALLTAQKKWKFVIINRRGWNFNPLNQDKIFH